MAYRNPAPGRISSRFNPSRVHPITRRKRPHNGTDVVAPLGTPVRAVHDGVVRTGYEPDGGGHWVILTDGSLETRYLHLSRRDVVPGQRVAAGDVIGLMGTSGASTGVHLHVEVRVSGVPTDPVPWLAAHGVTLGTDTPPPATPASIITQEDPTMLVIRKGTKKAGYHYALITGDRAVTMSQPAVVALKKGGVRVAVLPNADYDRLTTTLGSAK